MTARYPGEVRAKLTRDAVIFSSQAVFSEVTRSLTRMMQLKKRIALHWEQQFFLNVKEGTMCNHIKSHIFCIYFASFWMMLVLEIMQHLTIIARSLLKLSASLLKLNASLSIITASF